MIGLLELQTILGYSVSHLRFRVSLLLKKSSFRSKSNYSLQYSEFVMYFYIQTPILDILTAFPFYQKSFTHWLWTVCQFLGSPIGLQHIGLSL